MPSSPTTPPTECANCGARIPRGARSCPECGADERTGWRDNDEIEYGALDLPASAYEDHEDQSHARRPSRHVNGVAWYWWVVGVGLLLLLGLGALGLR